MRHLIVVDMQSDFYKGPLVNEAAVEIIPNIVKQVLEAREQGNHVIFTRNTQGTEIIPELIIDVKNDTILDKDRFGYINWKNYIKPKDEVVICGVLTPIIASIALTLKTIKDVEVSVLKDCCASLSTEDDEAAYRVMATCHCKIV